MVMSLQEQLKKSGLVDEKKAKQLKRAKVKQEKLVRKNQAPSDAERKLELLREKQALAAKDRQLNQQKNAVAQNAALKAQINQLVETNSVKPDGDKKYGYVDAGKIKNLWINQAQIDQLSRGILCIVSHASGGVLVPRAVAEKIQQRDASAILHKVEANGAPAEDDPYAKYEIPDDLDW
ncbi:MAG: hypothetical protein ACI95C_000748 [Pseudohongiellaceae bacterium]|jgi:uncharacterized protein YaiL (DUF2058 family)